MQDAFFSHDNSTTRNEGTTTP